MGNVKENSAVTKVFGFPFWGGGESTVSFAEHARQWVFCKSCWFCFNFTSLMELGGLSLNGGDEEAAAAAVFAAAATFFNLIVRWIKCSNGDLFLIALTRFDRR